MSKFLGLAAAALSLAAASPALADAPAPNPFTGLRVGLEVGVVSDQAFGTDKATYGATVGYDLQVAPSVVLGPVVGFTGLFQDEGTSVRELSAGARLGVRVASRTLVYGVASYSNLDADGVSSVDGYKLGLGVEQKLGRRVYAHVETRYADYQHLGDGLYQTVVGVSYRF